MTLFAFSKEAMMATGTVKFFNAQKGFGFIVQDNGGQMCSFTSLRSSALACIVSMRVRSFRLMCRPIRVVASPLRQTCKRPNVRYDDYAGAEALAFTFETSHPRG
jgi:hypothetical protein